MNQIDKKIFSMAQSEQIELPPEYENRIHALILNLPKKKESGSGVRMKKMLAIAAGFVVIISISFCGYMVNAGSTDVKKIIIEESELDMMYVIPTNPINEEKNEYGFIEYQWNSYDEMEAGLGIALLRSDNEYSEKFMNIMNETDNISYHIIHVDNYAYNGVENNAVIDLKICIRCNEEQSMKGLLAEYLGDFQRRGAYISKQGYQVVMIGNRTLAWQTVDDNTVNGKLESVFVADGILYQLSGEVSVNQMKEIIDSLHY